MFQGTVNFMKLKEVKDREIDKKEVPVLVLWQRIEVGP
jgi:hypothetical protein